MACLNIRQSAKPSTTPRWIPNPMIRRVYWSMTTSTQYVCNAIDSQRNKSRLQRLSFIWPMNVSHEGPSSDDVGEYCVASDHGPDQIRRRPLRTRLPSLFW